MRRSIFHHPNVKGTTMLLKFKRTNKTSKETLTKTILMKLITLSKMIPYNSAKNTAHSTIGSSVLGKVLHVKAIPNLRNKSKILKISTRAAFQMKEQWKEMEKMFIEEEIKVLVTSVTRKGILMRTKIIVGRRTVVNFPHIRRKRGSNRNFWMMITLLTNLNQSTCKDLSKTRLP